MTMKFSKKLFIVVAVTFLSIVSSFLFMQSPSIAKASTEPTFSVTGAQIRESDPAGIRFVTNVPKTLYNDSLKFGTLLLPSEMLQENQTITLENYESLDVLNIETKNWYIGPQDTEDTGNVYVYYSTIVGNYDAISNKYLGLSENYYDVDFTAISYYWDGVDTSTAVYTEVCERSLLQVASTLLADPSYNGNKTYLNQIVDACTSENTLSFAEGTEYSCKGTETITLTVQGNNGLPVAWASSDTNVATVENGVVTGVGFGTTTITATLGSKVASFVVTFAVPSTTPTDLELVPIRNQYDTAGISNYSYNSATYVEEFEGANGVIKVDLTGWGGFYFKALQDASVYEDVDYVVVRMYVTDASVGVFYVNDKGCLTSTVAGEWVDYKFNASDVNFSSNNRITPNSDNHADWSIYIDEIYAVRKSICTGNQVVNIESVADFAIFTKNEGTIEYLSSFEGENNVIKANVTGAWGGGLQFVPQQDMANFTQKYLVVRMYFVGGSDVQGTIWMNGSNANIGSQVTANVWMNYYFSGDQFREKVAAQGYCRITNAKPNTVFYVSDIWMEDSIAVSNNGVIEDFADSSSTASFVNATSVEHLAEFEGRQGVVKVTVATPTDLQAAVGFTIKSTTIPSIEISAGDWDYLEVVFYGAYSKWIMCNGKDINKKNTVGWFTMQVPKSHFTNLTTFANNLTGSGVNLLSSWTSGANPLTEVYFDSIKLCKNA